MAFFFLYSCRHVDSQARGFISFKAYDPGAFEVLRSFKSWAEQHFGSLERALQVLDEDRSGSVTLPELKRACQKRRGLGTECKNMQTTWPNMENMKKNSFKCMFISLTRGFLSRLAAVLGAGLATWTCWHAAWLSRKRIPRSRWLRSAS